MRSSTPLMPRIRAECVNASWFFSLADARERIEAWRIDYYNTKAASLGPGSLDAQGLRSAKNNLRTNGQTPAQEDVVQFRFDPLGADQRHRTMNPGRQNFVIV